MSSPTFNQLPSRNDVWDMIRRIKQRVNDTLKRSAFGAFTNPISGPQSDVPSDAPRVSDRVSFDFATRSSLTTEPTIKYTFMVRSGHCYAVANGKVYDTTTVLRAILRDPLDHKLLEIRKVSDFAKESRPPFNVDRRANELDEDSIDKFDVYQAGKRIGLIACGDDNIQIFFDDDNIQLVVRSSAIGEFLVFRDELSLNPLCNIKSDPLEWRDYSTGDIRGNLEFFPKSEMSIEEQQLCIAAAFAYKVSEVQRFRQFSQHVREEYQLEDDNLD